MPLNTDYVGMYNTDHTPADVFDYINTPKHSNQQHYPGPKETGGLFLCCLGARKCIVDDDTTI